MKNTRNIMLIIFIVFSFTSCSDDTITNAPNYYDFNGGFENSVNNYYEDAAGWYPTVLPETKDFVKFNWDGSETHSGNYAVSISIDNDHPTKDTIAYNWTKRFQPFEIDREYEIKGWVKIENVKRHPFIAIQCLDKNNKIIRLDNTFSDKHLVGTQDWSEVSTKFAPPSGTNEIRIRIGLVAPNNNGGKVWFDDLSIE